jgi:IS5 family transposase
MPKQRAFPSLTHAMKKRQTRRERFLSEMDAVVPWERLLGLVEPHYPKAGSKGGRPPMPLETMLRVYFLQNWYALSDPMAEETLYDSEAMRRFAGIELGDDRIPDETTILNFRHLLERHGLTVAIFADVSAHLADRGITLRSGTLVDATIIDAPSSTKNTAGLRDPEMSSTKTGNDRYFGMKAHVGVDADSGAVHNLDTSTAKLHDREVWDELLHGEETSVWADRGWRTFDFCSISASATGIEVFRLPTWKVAELHIATSNEPNSRSHEVQRIEGAENASGPPEAVGGAQPLRHNHRI